MNILEFRYLTKSDLFDDSYPHWSRKYEYPTVLEEIKKRASEFGGSPKIHNSSWGVDEEHHQKFKNLLEADFGVVNVTNSDIVFNGIPNTCYHDITQTPNENFKEDFDIVLNISAIEEIPGDHDRFIINLYDQVKPGGYLICTFDYPGLRLEKFEEIFTKKGEEDKICLSNFEFWYGPGDLNVLLFIAQKEQ